MEVGLWFDGIVDAVRDGCAGTPKRYARGARTFYRLATVSKGTRAACARRAHANRPEWARRAMMALASELRLASSAFLDAGQSRVARRCAKGASFEHGWPAAPVPWPSGGAAVSAHSDGCNSAVMMSTPVPVDDVDGVLYCPNTYVSDTSGWVRVQGILLTADREVWIAMYSSPGEAAASDGSIRVVRRKPTVIELLAPGGRPVVFRSWCLASSS